VTAPQVVTCSNPNCDKTYDEDDPRVTFIFGEWVCMWEDECGVPLVATEKAWEAYLTARDAERTARGTR